MRNSLFILLLVSIACADNQINITVTQSQCNNTGDLLMLIQNLPVCIVESSFSYIFGGLNSALRMFMDSAFGLILAVPDINWFCGPYSTVMAILESLYTIIIMGLGLYYIVRSSDVEGRITAKHWLKSTFLMVIVLTFSFQIFELILQTNNAISSNLLSQASTNFFSVNSALSDLVFANFILSVFLVGGSLTFFTLLIRYMFLPFLLLLFPVAVFLYFLPISEGFGRFLIKLILLIIFMSSVDALLILGFFSLFNTTDPNLADAFIRAMAGFMAFSAIGLVNLIIYIIALLMAVQQGLKLAGEVIAQVVRLAILASLL